MPTALFTLPSFDMPSRWGTSFFNRYILPRSFLSNFITGVGHGDPTTFTGQNKQVLWKVGQYDPSECEGKVIKLLSCLCGKELGPDLIRNGARAFQGYTELFGWFVDNKYVLTPWRDPVASPEQKAWMLHNRNSLIMLGDPNAQIEVL